MRRSLAATAVAAAAWLAVAAPAQAEVTSVFGGAVACTTHADGVRSCGDATGTTVPTWDGAPIDVNVALPPAPASGADGGFPLVMMFHGWGGSEYKLAAMRRFVARGYAVFSMSDRGWGGSCSGQTNKSGACEKGHNRLLDTLYEVRDAQHFAGRLADQRLVAPKRIGAWGSSYGGGISMALAALRDRVAVGENADGTLRLERWRSPGGLEMEVAAATPDIPWTDLAYSLVPNGRTLDYVADAPYSLDVPGVMKASFVTGLFAVGLSSSNYAVHDPHANFFPWYASLVAGDPYQASPAILEALSELKRHHSSYYIDDSRRPAPLLISSGSTDDLFPPDEALRFYNRTRTRHRGADVSLVLMDHGHQRGQNKRDDIAYLTALRDEWLDFYVKGDGGEAPFQGVRVRTQTCPSTAPSELVTAPSWREIGPGEIRLEGGGARTVRPQPSFAPALPSQIPGAVVAPLDPSVLDGLHYDPIVGGQAFGGACADPPASGVSDSLKATYDWPVATGFLMVGSPTIVAGLTSPGPTSQLAARLVDVAPDGRQTLVARGVYRPDVTIGAARQVFQLHPNGYRFAAGHTVRLELLPMDFPYARHSNGQLPIGVSDLELRLPTTSEPGEGPVTAPAPKVVPPGYELARDYRSEKRGGSKRPEPHPPGARPGR